MAKAIINKTTALEIIRGDDHALYLNGKVFDFDKADLGDGHFHILKDNKSFSAEVLSVNRAEKKVSLLVNGKKSEVQLKEKIDLLLEKLGMAAESSRKVNVLKAPMPGLILDIKVEEGTEVKAGDPLFILEAMKMENVLKSPGDGIVKSVSVKKGNSVEKNQVLITFRQDGEAV